MKFKRRSAYQLDSVYFDIVPWVNCVILLLVFFLLLSNMVVSSGIPIKLPTALSSEEMGPQTAVVAISSEDIVYLKNKPVQLNELSAALKEKKYSSIFIRADRNASMGVVAGIYDICKRQGIEKIGMATTYDN